MKRTLRIAHEGDLAMVWSAVRAAHVFSSREELERFFHEAPWRIQVTDAGEAAVLERWREHLDIASVRGLWCAERRVAPIMQALAEVTSRQGFSDLLSPVVPESRMQPYVDAGMRVSHRIVTMRLDRLQRVDIPNPTAPGGVSLRLATYDDIGALLVLDQAAFEVFWRGDVATIRRYLGTGRVMVAAAEGKLIGYTLATVERGEGMLGRLAVIPERRGNGFGTLLLCDALQYLARAGVSTVALCTQEDNATSRSLYSRVGFREVGETSVFLSFGRMTEPPTG